MGVGPGPWDVEQWGFLHRTWAPCDTLEVNGTLSNNSGCMEAAA